MTDLKHVTADGVEVKRGDSAWRVLSYGYPRKVKLDTHHLYWMGRGDGYFASEQAALENALDSSTKKLKRAHKDAKRETKRIAELKRRIRESERPQ